MEIQYEYYGGRKHKMSPVGYHHNKADKRIKPLLDSLITLKAKDNEFESTWDTWVVPEEGKLIAPDYAVFKKPVVEKDNKVIGVPVFVAETISPSTGRADRTSKKEYYQKLEVSEYWIVDPTNKNIEVYALNTTDWNYELVDIYQKFTSDEWASMTDEDKAEHPQIIKIGFLNAEVDIKDLFAD